MNEELRKEKFNKKIKLKLQISTETMEDIKKLPTISQLEWKARQIIQQNQQ